MSDKQKQKEAYYRVRKLKKEGKPINFEDILLSQQYKYDKKYSSYFNPKVDGLLKNNKYGL